MAQQTLSRLWHYPWKAHVTEYRSEVVVGGRVLIRDSERRLQGLQHVQS